MEVATRGHALEEDEKGTSPTFCHGLSLEDFKDMNQTISINCCVLHLLFCQRTLWPITALEFLHSRCKKVKQMEYFKFFIINSYLYSWVIKCQYQDCTPLIDKSPKPPGKLLPSSLFALIIFSLVVWVAGCCICLLYLKRVPPSHQLLASIWQALTTQNKNQSYKKLTKHKSVQHIECVDWTKIASRAKIVPSTLANYKY